MGSRARKGSACPSLTGLSGNDLFFTIANVSSVMNNAVIPVSLAFSNTNAPISTVGNNSLSTANLVLRSVAIIPSASASNGVPGQLLWDSGFVYVCVANNSWKRAALTTF